MFPRRYAIIPARIVRSTAGTPTTSEASDYDGFSSCSERSSVLAARNRDFCRHIRDYRQADSFSSLEGDRTGQERGAGDPAGSDVDRVMHYHRGGGALMSHVARTLVS